MTMMTRGSGLFTVRRKITNSSSSSGSSSNNNSKLKFYGLRVLIGMVVTVIVVRVQLPLLQVLDEDVASQDRYYGQHNDQQQRQRRPVFVLHVGPSKTGTTSIQRTFDQRNVQKLLEKDHYIYLGTKLHGPIYNEHCGEVGADKKKGTTSDHQSSQLSCTLSSQLLSHLRSIHKKDPTNAWNVFGSNEALHTPNSISKLMAWKNAIIQAEDDMGFWELHIVITYRRFHEWVPSTYNQHYKKFRSNNGSGGTILDPNGQIYWPGINGGYKIPSLPDFIKSRWIKKKGKSDSVNFYKKSYDTWLNKGHATNVSVFHMHQDGDVGVGVNDLSTNFACQVLPNAYHTCNGLMKESEKKKKKSLGGASSSDVKERENTSVNLDYDILAVYAYENGYINANTTNRAIVVQAIKEYHINERNGNIIDLPQACPSSAIMDKLYELSLQIELWSVSVRPPSSSGSINISPSSDQTYHLGGDNSVDSGKFMSSQLEMIYPNRLHAFNASWERTIKHNLLCSVDPSLALKQDHWKQFFQKQHFSAPITTNP